MPREQKNAGRRLNLRQQVTNSNVVYRHQTCLPNDIIPYADDEIGVIDVVDGQTSTAVRPSYEPGPSSTIALSTNSSARNRPSMRQPASIAGDNSRLPALTDIDDNAAADVNINPRTLIRTGFSIVPRNSRDQIINHRPISDADSSQQQSTGWFRRLFSRRAGREDNSNAELPPSFSRSASYSHKPVQHSLSATGSITNGNGNDISNNPRRNITSMLSSTATLGSQRAPGAQHAPPRLVRNFSRLRPPKSPTHAVTSPTTHTPCICKGCQHCVVVVPAAQPRFVGGELEGETEDTMMDHCDSISNADNEVDDDDEVYNYFYQTDVIGKISRFHFAWTVGGLLTYLADFITDISVAVEYKQEGHPWWFAWTIGFIILPSIVMAVYSCIWYFEDNRHACNDPHIDAPCCKHATKREWTIRILFMSIGMAPLLRYLEAVRHAWGVYRARDHPAQQRDLYILYIWADADASMLRLFEAFLESAPQLVLQLYTVFKSGKRLDQWRDLWDNKAFSIMFSWVSMAFTLVQFHRSLRAIRASEKKQVRWYGSLMQFFWHLFFIGARVLVIVSICSSSAKIGLLFIATHYVVMYIWIFSQGTTFCSERFTWQEYAYDACIAVIYMFCFFNVNDSSRTRWRHTIFLCITIPENIAGVIWYYFNYNHTLVQHGYRLLVLLAVFGMMFTSICLCQIPYYYFCHPQRGVLRHSRREAIDADDENREKKTRKVLLPTTAPAAYDDGAMVSAAPTPEALSPCVDNDAVEITARQEASEMMPTTTTATKVVMRRQSSENVGLTNAAAAAAAAASRSSVQWNRELSSTTADYV